MASIRGRLAFGYGVGLVLTLGAFAVALLVARRAAADQDLASESVSEAEHALGILHDYATQERPAVDIRMIEGRERATLTPGMGVELDRSGGYLLLFGRDDQLLYVSPSLRLLQADDTAAFRVLLDETRALRSEGQGIKIPLPDPVRDETRPLLFAMRRDTVYGSRVPRVVAGVPTTSAALAPDLLFGTMVAVLPLILISSLLVAYYVGGRALAPVEQVINEVEAISDGRSLHRRLAPAVDAEELSRLTMTLNAMIARLETSFGALRRFTADASHELKTPLAVLRADVERAMHPGTTPGERMMALEEALAEISRTSSLVDSLLTLARADEGRFDVVREPVALEPLVREVFETASILGEGAGLAVVLSTAEPSSVAGDAQRLRQLFLNLVTNAIKYTPAGGRVELALVRRAVTRDAVFSVRDTGIGIAATDLPHIFDRFWRADQARTRRAQGAAEEVAVQRSGAGLGLAISQWIAQAHGGALTVQSRLGRGSVFSVALPVSDLDPAVSEQGSSYPVGG